MMNKQIGIWLDLRNSSYVKSIAALLFILGISARTAAQTDQELLARVVEENQKAVEALVMYPAETRVDILEVASYPEALIKIEGMQAQTSAGFKKAVEAYPQETQEIFWDMTRYPGLVRQIVRESGGTNAGLEKILKAYPASVHGNALHAGQDHFALLQKIDDLNQAAESAYETITGAYPPKTRAALQRLLALPEVLSLLTENIRLTILAGDLYRKQPEWTLRQADSLNLVVARRNAQEVEDWKKSLEDDPQAKGELSAAAKSYATEKGYQDDLYDTGNDDLYYEAPEEQPLRVVEHHYYNYPYWFGYPSWYDYPYWRPYPWWWEWGFYYGPGGSIVVIGLPSYHFTHWYFHDPWHHDRWYHLSNHFVGHYNHHPESGGSINTGVVVWRRRHGTIINDAWLKEDGRRTERFREFGRLSTALDKHNRNNPGKQLDEKDYLDRNAGRYPEMTKVKSPKPLAGQQAPRTEAPARPPRVEKEAPNPDVLPSDGRKKQLDVKPEAPVVRPPRTIQPELKKGREQHENTLEKEKARTSTEPRRTTAPKVTPPPVKAPAPVKTQPPAKTPPKREKSGRSGN